MVLVSLTAAMFPYTCLDFTVFQIVAGSTFTLSDSLNKTFLSMCICHLNGIGIYCTCKCSKLLFHILVISWLINVLSRYMNILRHNYVQICRWWQKAISTIFLRANACCLLIFFVLYSTKFQPDPTVNKRKRRNKRKEYWFCHIMQFSHCTLSVWDFKRYFDWSHQQIDI